MGAGVGCAVESCGFTRALAYRFSYTFSHVMHIHLFHCLHPLVGSIVDTLYNRYCLDLPPNTAIDILYNKYFLCKQGDGRLQTALPRVPEICRFVPDDASYLSFS